MFTPTRIIRPRLNIVLALSLLWSTMPDLSTRAAEQSRLFYHPEIKAKLKDGKVLLFPPNLRLGTLQYTGAKAHRGKSISASGRIELPGQAEVMLVPSSYLRQNPALINCFEGAISGIEIKTTDDKTLLQQLAAKNTIKTLKFSGLTLDEEMIWAINSFPQLKSLQFERNAATKSPISNKIKRMQKLESLSVTASTTVLLKEVGSSKYLKKLELSGANLALADFAMLQNLPTLQFLSIQESQYPDAAIAYFPRFKTLKVLWLGKRHWSKESFSYLKRLTNLQELHVQASKEDLAQYLELYNALPGILKP
ncbi:hypothetical protein KBI23_00565 [bacterium]|nr:hypothetical protein [bacterium]